MNPKQILETAAHAYATDEDTNIELVSNFYKGIENAYATDDNSQAVASTMQLPSVVLDAGDFEEVVIGTRNYRGRLSVIVNAEANDTTDEEFDAMCREVFSKFAVQDLKTKLTEAAEDFHCYHAQPSGASGTTKTAENIWMNTLNIDCVIACDDLT